MIMHPRISHHVAFALLFAIVGLLTFWLVRPYLDIIAFSLMSVIVLKPLYDWVLPHVGGRRGLATALTVTLFLLAVIAPLAPSEAYCGSLRCLKYVPASLSTRLEKYSTANATLPMVRSSGNAKNQNVTC